MSGVLVMDVSEETDGVTGGALRQGFLCPFCLQDLGDLNILHAHVQKCHPKSVNADDALYHLKDIFGKAKQKILQIDAPFSAAGETGASNTAISPSSTSTVDFYRPNKIVHTPPELTFYSQSFGVTRNHTDYFLKCRAPCINEAAVKTNNLIIRLDKLINQCPSDSNKRKAFERETVPWVMDRDVYKCRTCSIKFSLTKRRHHCRLCGEVICHSCSKFLSFVDARKLTNPAFAAQLLEEMNKMDTKSSEEAANHLTRSTSVAEAIKQAVSGESLQSMRLKSEKLLSSTLSLVKRDGTEVSLASLLQQDENEHLRICSECKSLLDMRNEKMDLLTSPPMLVVLYERLCYLFHNARKLLSSYARISESLSRGETMYTLDSAVNLRNRLVQLQKEIDSVSSHIETYGVDEANSQKCTSPREKIIQKNIRNFALQTLQEFVSQMSLPPSEDRYSELQEKRRADIKRRTDLERKKNAFALKPSTSNPGLNSSGTEKIRQDSKGRLKESVSFAGIDSASGDDGWTPSRMLFHSNPFIDEEDQVDPLQEQIFIIKGYLKQAAEDGRLEEVEILERNLRDLELEAERHNDDATSEQ